MILRQTLAAAGVSALVLWLVTPKLFAEFSPVREKVVRGTIPASGERLAVPVVVNAYLKRLRPPFAVISRVRNRAASPLVIRVTLDDQELCSARIPPGESRRLDCAVRRPWPDVENHTIALIGSSPDYALEYLEVASHYGALSPGARDLVIGPTGFSGLRHPPVWHLALIFGLLMLAARSALDRQPSRKLVSVVHLVLMAIVGTVLAIVVVSGAISPYSVLISDTCLDRLLLLAAFPVLGRWAFALVAVMRRPRVLPVVQAAGVGLVVGAVFLSFAIDQVTVRFGGNASGLARISHRYFDQAPLVNGRDDLRDSLVFADGVGYDGQFFYLMAFDPFLTALREQPREYARFIDAPAYRYGRIGFSVLTKVFSFDQPARYPVTMAALVIGALALSACLLSLIARAYGFTLWYGVLIVFIPGFWQSAQLSLPEPVAVAFFLGGYLCLIRQKWWVGGVLLALSLLVRETGGAFVLAVAAGLFVTGRRREGLIVGLLAFLPVVLWKGFVAWVFWPISGVGGLFPHPADVGLPMAGVWQFVTTTARGDDLNGQWSLMRSALTYPLLTTAGSALAGMVAVKRPSPIALAGLFYAVLTVTFNYEGVWLYLGNAHRLTTDLFVALALVFLQAPRARHPWPWVFALFWVASAWYVFFGTFDARDVQHSITRWF